MSVKHVASYYKQLSDQYQEMVDCIKSLEEEAARGLVEPERIERLQKQVDPIKQNYERWSYMMFLLHQPNRKEKRSRYYKQNAKLLRGLSESNSLSAVLAENATALQHVGK